MMTLEPYVLHYRWSADGITWTTVTRELDAATGGRFKRFDHDDGPCLSEIDAGIREALKPKPGESGACVSVEYVRLSHGPRAKTFDRE